jgi:deoxyribose-phosphate aldolase
VRLGKSVLCVQPCWVSLAARSLEGTGAKVASVVGFPHGLIAPT